MALTFIITTVDSFSVDPFQVDPFQVDPFQGKEGQIVILDTVIARIILLPQAEAHQKDKKRVGNNIGKQPANDNANANAESDNSFDEDCGDESYIRGGQVHQTCA